MNHDPVAGQKGGEWEQALFILKALQRETLGFRIVGSCSQRVEFWNFVFQETLKKDGVYWEIIGVFHKPSIPTFMKHLKKIHEYPIIIHGKNTFIYR